MTLRKKHVIYIEFFKDVDPKRLEDTLRSLTPKTIPPFRNIKTMISYKNMKRIDIREEHPLLVTEEDVNVVKQKKIS